MVIKLSISDFIPTIAKKCLVYVYMSLMFLYSYCFTCSLFLCHR